jgi:hypothetical protein
MGEHAQSRSQLRWRVTVGALPGRWQRSTLLALAIALVGTLAVAMLQGEKTFFTDAGGYWGLGTTFTVNGHFSLLNFHDPIKGYAFPLMLYVLQWLASHLAWTASSIAKLFNVLTFATIGTVLGPALVQTVWPTQPRWGLGRRLALMAILLVFWSGFLNFPLSDFPALATALLTLIAVARVDSPRWMLLAGAALALTLDIRESYLVFVPAVVAIVAWTWFEQRGTPHASGRRRAICAGVFILGFAVVSLPQSLSAHRYNGTWSFVPGASVTEPVGVFYGSGLKAQSYDTYVFNGAAAVEMRYVFPAGERLLAEQSEDKITSTSQYVGLYASHPLVMADMLVRHVINGLDPLYSTPYVENLHNAGRTWGRIAAFGLLFLALLRLLWPAARRMLGPGRLRYLLALASCCLTTIPTQMERRYMLPVYLIAYLVALTPRWPNPLAQRAESLRRLRTPAAIAVAFVLYASIVWYVTSDAIDHVTLTDALTHTRLSLN